MDFNFTDLKKEAASTADNIFGHTTEAAKQVGHDFLGNIGGGGGSGGDNSHTEQSFGNDQKEMDFEHVDPQTFVQRMSAGAKEAQEQLDAKFSQTKDEVEDFFGQTNQNVKQGVAGVTHDFMNAERGLMEGAADKAKEIEKKAAQAVDDFFGSHLGGGDGKYDAPLAPLTETVQSANNNINNFMDDINAPMTTFGKTSTQAPTPAAPTAPPASKDSDNESSSISYNPSPVKKIPATDALKEQDNEKFISSEDLLGDFKEERTSTPDSQASAKVTTQPKAPQTQQHVPTTDLDNEDDDEDFVQAEIPAKKETDQQIAAPVVEPPTPVVIPVAKPAPVQPEPVKTQPPIQETKKETPTPAIVDTKPKASKTVNSQQQPNIVSVEDIFYKYGLGKCSFFLYFMFQHRVI